MTSAAARKGSQFERDVAEYMRGHGLPNVERAYGAGRPDDVGDLDGLPAWCFELKNQKTHDWAGWVDELRREQANARAQYGVVIAKRRGQPVRRAYVVMELEQLVRLLVERETLA